MDDDKDFSKEAEPDESSGSSMSELEETLDEENEQVEIVETPNADIEDEFSEEELLAAAFEGSGGVDIERSNPKKDNDELVIIEDEFDETKKPKDDDESDESEDALADEEAVNVSVESNQKNEESDEDIQEESDEEGDDDEDVSTSGSIKSHKGLIAFACVAVVTIGIVAAVIINSNKKQEPEPVVTIDDLTDEQKEKLGIEPKKEENAEASEIEDKDNYSDEYKEYLKLSDEEKSKLEVIPRKEEVPDEKIDEIKEDTDDKVIATLPEKFDLRDKIDITVGDQGAYGLCWDYASSTALETHLKLRGIDYNPSELQIDFLSSDLMYGGRNLHDGGTFQYYTDIASSIGTISEASFSSLKIDPDASYVDSSNNYDYFKLAKNDNPLYVTKTVDFPAIRKSEGDVLDKTEDELKEFRDLVKAHIMTNGSLYTAVTGPWGFGISRYCEKNGEGCEVDHAMSIIGWDDNYPKENFGKVDSNGHRVNGTPKHDGAYIILNSWGKDWNGSGAKDGVFYISYDEYSVESQLSGVVSTSFDDMKKINSISSKKTKDIIREKLSFYIVEKDDEEYISNYALDRVSYLNLSSSGLTDYDLKGITEVFSNLSSLTINDNDISDLSPISNLKNLQGINFSKNNVKDISALCSLDKVNSFDLSYNKIADVSCLKDKLGDHAFLNISGNKGVVGLDKLTSLSILFADDMDFESLEQLSSLNKLINISLRNNNIKSLAGLNLSEAAPNSLDLSGNKKLVDLKYDKPLQNLVIEDAGLTDISILNSIDANGVYASGNNFGDLSSFKNDKITQLDLSRNKNLSNLPTLSSVKSLNLSKCGITSFSDISGLNGVEQLILNDNEIASFEGVGGFSKVINIYIKNNKLTSLSNIEKLENLRILDISNNQITSLDEIKKITKLTSLYADNNSISNADVLTDLENLFFASLVGNKLTSVPSFTKQADIYLTLENNPIENAVVPAAVASINLKGCGVKTIDFSQVERLANITLDGNPGWNDYRNLISKSILGQQSIGRLYPYFSISTDYILIG